ncbi:fibronectin type III domain-containing protein [Winogradskyella flava]|uniref:fibronectin type III domain-containing protein n=1 Tax=Winogradskyella flava TaxID=1884876 RepID=UPI00248F4AF6|nr:fibronectin type III domain-containing protein [Winogradskyella flava]
MKKFYSILIITFLIIGCSEDDTVNQIEEEEIVNLPPNNFDIEIINISSESATISWNEAVDPENDAVTYDIYLNQVLIIENITELTYEFTDLEELTDYSGKIIATDSNDNETESTFTFQTEQYFLRFLKRYDFGEVNYGGTGGYAPGGPYCMIKSSNGNYIVVGSAGFPDGTGYRFFLSKIDYNGNELWKNFYDYYVGDSTDFKVIETSSGYVLTGGTHLIKVDFDGNFVWNKEFVNNEVIGWASEIKSIKQDNQGNLFIIGYRDSSDPDVTQEAFLMKLDESGNIIWENEYKPTNRNYFNDLVINSSNELIIVGSVETSENGYEENGYWILKLNNQGSIIWEHSFGFGNHGVPVQIIIKSNGNYAFVGFENIFEVSPDGTNVVNYPNGLNYANSIAETLDNGFIVTGYNYFGDYGGLELIKYDASGNIQWNHIFQESFTYLSGRSVLTEDDGGYRIAGSSGKNFYYDEERPNLLIYKTDPDGNFE